MELNKFTGLLITKTTAGAPDARHGAVICRHPTQSGAAGGTAHPEGGTGAGWAKRPASAGAQGAIRRADFPTRSPGFCWFQRKLQAVVLGLLFHQPETETFPLQRVRRQRFNFFTAGEVRTKLLTCVGAEVNGRRSWADRI